MLGLNHQITFNKTTRKKKMSLPQETRQISAQTLNHRFADMLQRGLTKEAGEAGTPLVREFIRQDSVARKILPIEDLVASDLNPQLDSDQPVKYMEVEPQSEAASAQLYGTPRTRFYTLRRVPVYIAKVMSDEFTKNRVELMTIQSDVRKLLADNSTKDLSDQEDISMRQLSVRAVLRNAAVQRTSSPRLNGSTFGRAMGALQDRRRQAGKVVVASSRLNDLMDLPATAVGNDIATQTFREGVEKCEGLWGTPLVQTIKSDIYLPNEAWLYAPENYLGKFYQLIPPTLYVEQQAEIIKFYVYEYIGMGLALGEGIQQIAFNERV